MDEINICPVCDKGILINTIRPFTMGLQALPSVTVINIEMEVCSVCDEVLLPLASCRKITDSIEKIHPGYFKKA